MSDKRTAFEQANQTSQPSLAREFLHFLKHSKKFWLLPLLIMLLVFGLLIILSGTAVAPFIYTLF
jgi:hypothetical protein